MPTISELFGVDTPRPIEVSAVCPMGSGSNVEKLPYFAFQKETLKRFLNNLAINQPVFISGPSGVGKTEFCRQVAVRLNRNCHVISFGEETSLRELLGTFDLKPGTNGSYTEYRYGDLVQAITDPQAIVVLDEFNMAHPGVTAQLNRLLEAREIRIPETGERIRMADGTCLVATGNTSGGIDHSGLYAGSQVQNAATRTRFAGLRMTYMPEEREIQLLRDAVKTQDGRTLDDLIPLGKPTTELMVQVANAIRALVEEGRADVPFAVRNLLHWGRASMMNGSVVAGFQDAYLDLLTPDAQVAVAEVFKKCIGVDPETGMAVGGDS